MNLILTASGLRPQFWSSRARPRDPVAVSLSFGHRIPRPRLGMTGGGRCVVPILILLVSTCHLTADPVIIGSKKFTESYVLAEIAKRSLQNAGTEAEHRQGMGGTIILWEALRRGGIDVYPEYTGTIAEEVLKTPRASATEIRNALSTYGIGRTYELEFNDTYALVMRRDQSQQLGLKTISDLRAHP